MKYYWLWVDIDGRGKRWRMTRWVPLSNGFQVVFCDTVFHSTDEEFAECPKIQVDEPPAHDKMPVGIKGIRDPDSPCDAYAPDAKPISPDCETDGHYLCSGCGLRKRGEDEWEDPSPAEDADLSAAEVEALKNGR
jgi:hypothetical protein